MDGSFNSALASFLQSSSKAISRTTLGDILTLLRVLDTATAPKVSLCPAGELRFAGNEWCAIRGQKNLRRRRLGFGYRPPCKLSASLRFRCDAAGAFAAGPFCSQGAQVLPGRPHERKCELEIVPRCFCRQPFSKRDQPCDVIPSSLGANRISWRKLDWRNFCLRFFSFFHI